jgi:hypothetical protein
MSHGAATLIGESAIWTESLLTVDEGEPFFFDHPLDHVPGTLQLFGLLDLVRSVTGLPLGFERGTRLWLAVTFPMFCELGEPVRLGCSDLVTLSPGGWKIRAEQNGAQACSGELRLLPDPGAGGPAFELSERSAPSRVTTDATPARIAGHRVNRVNAANVMIGNTETDGRGLRRVPVISPRPGHSLRRSARGERSPEELIEAARQLSVLLEKDAATCGSDPQLILQSVETEFPCGITRGPLELRVTRVERRGKRVAYDFDLVLPRRDDALGRFRLTGRSVSRPAYDRMRGTR